ncbi:MAG: Flp pilus assembly protein CpaB [Eggerthellaceae bacterium]|nr:Flp pilus assembly protein CpaB [Eggerthellaceae bacterium]
MKRKATFLLSILCGVVCALAVFAYTAQIQREASQARAEALSRYGGEQLEVCVATQDIAAGDMVAASNVTTRQWLVDLLPADPVESFDSVSGQRATSSIVAGEVLSNRHFEGGALDIDIPSGLEAVSIEVEQAQAVGGALKTGAEVDVYAAGPVETALIASDVYVVSAGNASGTRTWVTLAVPPDLVEQLIAATQSSTLYLTLPAPTDSDQTDPASDESAPASEDEAAEETPDAEKLERDAQTESEADVWEEASEASPEERSEDDDA